MAGQLNTTRFNQRQFNAGPDLAPPLPSALQLIGGVLQVNPRARVEVCLDDPGTWTDWINLTDRVISPGIQTNRGRQSELERFQPGTAAVQLRNHDGYFGPSGTVLVNLVSNPSAEVDLVGYSNTLAAISRSVQGDVGSLGIIGSYGIAVVTTNAVGSGLVYGDASLLPAAPGLTFAASWYARRATAGSTQMRLRIGWYDSGDSSLGVTDELVDLDNDSLPIRFSVRGVAPSGADHVRISLQTAVAGGVFTFYCDALQFEVSLPSSANLLGNPSVEIDLTDWDDVGTATIARSNVAGHAADGDWGLLVSCPNLADVGVGYEPLDPLLVSPASDYVGSIFIRLALAGSKSLRLVLSWVDAADVLLVEDNHTVTVGSIGYARFAIMGIAPPAADHLNLYLVTNGAGQGVFDFLVDAAQFEVALDLSPNLITNPDFEASTTGYGQEFSAIARSSSAGVPHGGSWGLVVTTTNVIFSGVRWDPSPRTFVTPGLCYVCSLWARRAAAGSAAMGVWISFYTAGHSLVSESHRVITLNSTTYQRFSFTMTAPPTADHVVLWFLTEAASGVFNFYVDDLRFEAAAVPSAYAPPDPLNMLIDYVDGDQPNGVWNGPPHASPSYFGQEYSPNQRPMNRLRIISEWDDVDEPVIDGFVDNWTPEYPGPNASIVNLRVTDALSVFAIQTLADQPDFGFWGLLVTTTNTNDSGANFGGDGVLPVTPGVAYTAHCSARLAIQSTKQMEWLIVWFDASHVITGFAETLVSLNSEAFGRFSVQGTAPTGTTYAKVSFHTKIADGVFDFWLDALHLAADITPNDNLISNPSVEVDTSGYTALSSTMVRAELPPRAEERSDVRIARCLDEIGWPEDARDLGIGASYLLPQESLNGGSALPYLQLIEQTENGRLWVDKAGTVRFLGRWALGQPPYTQSVCTFGEDPDNPAELKYVSLVPSMDLTYVRNDIRLTGIMAGATEQVAQDADSIRRYFTRALSASGLLVTDNELAIAAAYLLDRYRRSRLRFLTLELAPGLMDPVTQWPIVLGLEISDRVTVKFTPPGQTIPLQQDCFIEGIRHNWTRAGYWQTILALSSYGIGSQLYPAGKSFFVVGTSHLGGNGVLVY